MLLEPYRGARSRIPKELVIQIVKHSRLYSQYLYPNKSDESAYLYRIHSVISANLPKISSLKCTPTAIPPSSSTASRCKSSS